MTLFFYAHIETIFIKYMIRNTTSMDDNNVRNLAVRLPIGTYQEVQKLVKEEKIALNVSDYCRQLITADLQRRATRND